MTLAPSLTEPRKIRWGKLETALNSSNEPSEAFRLFLINILNVAPRIPADMAIRMPGKDCKANDRTPLRQQVPGVSEAEAKPVIAPDSVGNDFRRIAMTRIGINRCVNAAIIPWRLMSPST